jgi:Fe2+ transport system protein FeoA
MWKKFTFFSEPPKIERPTAMGSSEQLFHLSEARIGDRVRVTTLCNLQSNHYLSSLGCVIDAEMQIISHSPSGSVIVILGEKQVGLGAAIAHSIVVTRLEDR